METAVILSHLIVVAALPANVCTTDMECKKIAWNQFGCHTYTADRDDTHDDQLGDLFICDKKTFEMGLAQWQATHK
jgi:hypothetical protein